MCPVCARVSIHTLLHCGIALLPADIAGRAGGPHGQPQRRQHIQYRQGAVYWRGRCTGVYGFGVGSHAVI